MGTLPNSKTHRGRAIGGIALAALVLAAAACTSRLRGGKSADLRPPTASASGVPFRIAKPVFFIAPAAPVPGKETAAPLYEVRVEYKSDPSAVYWANVDPALFHSNTFELTFADTGHGVPWKVTSVGEDKAQEFVKAIGTFVVGAIGIAAGERADVAAAGKSAIEIDEDPALEIGRDAVEAEIGRAKKGGDAAGGLPPEAFENLGPALEGDLGTTILVAPDSPEARAALVLRRTFDRRYAGLLAAKAEISADALKRRDAAAREPTTRARFRAFRALARQAASLGDAGATAATEAAAALAALLFLDARVVEEGNWRRAFVRDLTEKRAELEKWAVLGGPARAAEEGELADVEQRLYQALGMAEEYLQRRALERFLRETPYAPGPGGAARESPEAVSMLAEMEKARAVVAAIVGRSEARIAALLADPPSYTPPSDAVARLPWNAGGRIYPTTVRYDCGDGRGFSTPGWLDRHFKSRGGPPRNGDFVIVVEKGFQSDRKEDR